VGILRFLMFGGGREIRRGTKNGIGEGALYDKKQKVKQVSRKCSTKAVST